MSICINLFALHYFLWFSALTSIYGYVGVYAEEYANASASQYGLLNMILPFVTIGSKLFFCSLADRHRAYKSFFVAFLICSLFGYGSFAILPFVVKPEPKEKGVDYTTWGIICLMTSVSTISMSVISCLSDAFAMNSSRKRNVSYGFIRLWGTIGWGLSALAIAFLNQIESLPHLVPGLIMLIVLLTVDVVVVIFWPHKDDFELDKSNSDIDIEDIVRVMTQGTTQNGSNSELNSQKDKSTNSYGAAESSSTPVSLSITGLQEKQVKKTSNNGKVEEQDISSISVQWILFKEAAKERKSIFRYMTLFTISGALSALQWSFFFVYIKKIYPHDYLYITSISMIGQSMLGELPFFIISKKFIQIFGRSHTISISIISIGVRYLLYEYLLPNANMYFVVLTETLQGPCFGLFYVVMTEVGLDYSDCEEAIVRAVEKGFVSGNPERIQKLRQALRATMQSLMSACYEGLGVGIGSIVGGLVIDNFGFSNLWLYATGIAFTSGICNSAIEFFQLCKR